MSEYPDDPVPVKTLRHAAVYHFAAQKGRLRHGDEIRFPLPSSYHIMADADEVLPEMPVGRMRLDYGRQGPEWVYEGKVSVPTNCDEDRREEAASKIRRERDHFKALLEQSLYIGSWTSDQLAAWERQRDRALNSETEKK